FSRDVSRTGRSYCSPTRRSSDLRLNAEDPDRDFAPAPGRIAHLDLPTGPGVRADTGVREGDTIPADFDSMIAKVIANGRDRKQRSEEHTSELQSRFDLVCRLLLE